MLVVALAAAAIGVVFYATGLMGTLEAQSVDARFEVRGTQPKPEEIVVVGVDTRPSTNCRTRAGPSRARSRDG